MDQANPQPDVKQIFGNIIIVFAALTLPGVAWSLFGWIHLFLPLLVFMFLVKYGLNIGNRFILAGGGLAFISGIIFGTIEVALFSFSLIPAGYVLARSGIRGDQPALSGFKAAVTQTACWALLVAGLGALTGDSPYAAFLETMRAGIDEAIAHYRQSGSLDPDGMLVLENTLNQMKEIIPVILPSLFGSFALFSTWLNMVLGNRLAVRFFDQQIWPPYRFWQVPDKLIWLGIGCALLAFVPAGSSRAIAVNILLLLAVVYSFQGLAVGVFFMNKWRVPILLRSFIYVMVIFQTLGTILLLVVGVMETWFDFRRLNPTASKTGDDPIDE